MCGPLSMTVLENLRRIAAQQPRPEMRDGMPSTPLHRVVRLCARRGTAAGTIFARPGLNLAPQASEQAILQALPLARTDPAAAWDCLSTTCDGTIAGELVWVLSDLFDCLYSERVQALRQPARFSP